MRMILEAKLEFCIFQKKGVCSKVAITVNLFTENVAHNEYRILMLHQNIFCM